jgi:hypothetical protein
MARGEGNEDSDVAAEAMIQPACTVIMAMANTRERCKIAGILIIGVSTRRLERQRFLWLCGVRPSRPQQANN